MKSGIRTALDAALRAPAAGVLFALALLFMSPAARAQSSEAAPAGPDRAACVAAHTNAQELKRSGQLLEAESELKICASAGCPGAIISDCGQWITDLEQMTPSMIFEVRVDGKQVTTDLELEVDGTKVTDLTKAHRVNPGRHVVRVQVPNFEPREEVVALPEGQRMRLVAFSFESPREEPAPVMTPPPAAPPVMVRPTPVAVYPLLGVGFAGLASFGAFTALGKSEESELDDTCAPACTDDELSTMKRYYMIGDISLGVGAASLVAAGIVYLVRPEKPTLDAMSSIRVGPARAGEWRSLAVSVERTW